MDWMDLFRRAPADRPLPKAGCSIAFFVMLGLMLAVLGVMYVKYRMQG